MADTIKFQCNLDRFDVGVYGIPVKEKADTSIPLGFEVLLNGKSVCKIDHVRDACQIAFDIDDSELSHKIQFVMFGKTADHTKIDDQGNISFDALLRITNIVIDDIDISLLLNPKSIYSHNFNGSQSEIEDKFYGDMGCNGTVTFEFTTPFYLWLLENM
jgi:hypothetical protein